MNIIKLLSHDVKMAYYRKRFDLEVAKAKQRISDKESDEFRYYAKRALCWLEKMNDNLTV